MPPQMGLHGACDMIPSPRTRRALAHAAEKTVKDRTSTATSASSKNSVRSRATVGASAATAPVTCPVPVDFKADTGTNVRSRITAMQHKFGAHLKFLVAEFTKMEAHLSPQVRNCSVDKDEDSGAQQQLSRLRYFIEHVEHTMSRMEQAKSGGHHYTSPQLDMLEEHIAKRLLPVKDRMLAQLAQRSSHSVDGHNVDAINPTRTDDRVDDPIAIASGTIASPSSIPISPRSSSAGGPDLKLEDATAVSNHWMGSSLLLSSPSRFGNDADPKGETAIARPCSSLSLAGLGDLCGDEEAQDDCGGAFLVADCDDVNGSGIGLDLYDLGQDKDSFLTSPRERCNTGRSESMSTRSSVSALTDGELSDDCISVDADHASGLLGTDNGKVNAQGRSGEGAVTPLIKTGIDQEMGELSELFAPDAFLLSTVLETEEMDTAADPTEAETAMSMKTTVEIKEEVPKSEATKPAVASSSVSTTASSALRRVAATSPSVSAVAQQQQLTASVVAPLKQGDNAPFLAAPASSAGGASSAVSGLKHDCRCGQAACPSLITAARKRSSEFSLGTSSTLAGMTIAGGSTSAPMSLVTGMSYTHQTSRQRKRQRSLAPVLSAPRTVTYECALCKEGYQSEISSNPWWSLFRHECPRCHRMQTPRVDATSAAVSVDFIHAVCAEEGEENDSDGYGSDSCSESDDDGDDDGREGLAAFDTEVIAGDASVGCPNGRLSTFQASRLLVLMAHARTCPGHHAKAQHAEVCRSTKFLMLHIRDCTGHTPNGEPCEHRWCRPCKSLLSHLVRCPTPSACRICTPLDLPGPLRQLRELNVAQARAAAVVSPSPPAATIAPGSNRAAVVKMEAAISDRVLPSHAGRTSSSYVAPATAAAPSVSSAVRL